MGKPKNTKNIGSYWSDSIDYTEDEIISWVKGLKINEYYTPFSSNLHNTQRGFLSVVNRKLGVNSKYIFNYYFRKLHLDSNKCLYCSCEIEKPFLISLKRSVNQLPNWCEKHYIEKKWLEGNGAHSAEANIKRSNKRKLFLATPEGGEYCKNVGKLNKVNTKRWKSNLTDKEREVINLKTSISQIRNILGGKFDPQKNYNHYRKNTCYLSDTEYIFRSSWEVIFFISNPSLKYETLRIKYLKNNGKVGVYIPDFIDEGNKIIYELKPRRNFIKQQNKMDGAIKWCLEEGYKFIWVNEDNLLSYIDKNDNKDSRNSKFYIKAYKGINGEIKNKINKKNRK